MAATAVLPLLTPAERRALQLSPAERSAYESFPGRATSSSSSSSVVSPSSITSIRDLAPRVNENAIHDPNWQVLSNLPFSPPGRSHGGNNNDNDNNAHALTKATRDLIALQPPTPSSDYAPPHHSLRGNVQSLSPTSASAAGGVKVLGHSVRSNSSGSTNTAQSTSTNGSGVGNQHHRPIAPAPPTGRSQNTRASTNSSPPSAKRRRRSLSPPRQPTEGIRSNSVSYRTSPSTLCVVAGHPSTYVAPGSPSATSQQGSSSTKATLLTPQQKKANHIQSEQKRRANIRRGYEALCETIPALREAIRAEEEMGHAVQSSGLAGGIAKKRRPREESSEKVDGRAGPRSESVVLQKTIEHIQGLLYEKATLISRLERACAILGPSHPALNSADSIPPLWEREWDGGKGLMVINGEVLQGSDEE